MLLSGLGGALSAAVVAGMLAGRLGLPISGLLLVAAAFAGGVPGLLALLRGRWAARWPESTLALLALVAVGGVGLWLAWPALLPLGRSVDAVHQFQLVQWIAVEQRFPPLDGQTQGLMGEMIAYPPGLALAVNTAAALNARPPLEALFPTVALLGGMVAALATLLACAAAGARAGFALLPGLAVPLLLLAHRAYGLEAYTDHSYYAMVLGMALVLLSCAWLIVEPRLGRAGALQLGLALAALLATYPLWLPIPAGLAVLALLGRWLRERRADTRERAAIDMQAGRDAPQQTTVFPTANGLLVLALVFAPSLLLALVDLPQRLATGRTVLAHEGVVTLPNLFSLTPVLLALPCAALLASGLRRADERGWLLLAGSGLALAEMALLALVARLGLTASYHSYKILFVLVPLSTAVAGAGLIRVAALPNPATRWAGLVAAVLVLALTSARFVLPLRAEQIPSADLVRATRWLLANDPDAATRAIAVNAPAGPLSYWVQVALLGQRRDEAQAAMRAFTLAPSTAAGWAMDSGLPDAVVAFGQAAPPPGAAEAARFGDVSVLRRAPLDVEQINPMVLRYSSVWEEERLKTALELIRPIAGPLPAVELRLLADDTLVNSFVLQPNPERTRTQYLGADVLPDTLGGVGYVNAESYPTFEPPAALPVGEMRLMLRLAYGEAALDERLLATWTRTQDGQFANLALHSGELDYLRQSDQAPSLAPIDGSFSNVTLSGWSAPASAAAGRDVDVWLRWGAAAPITRSVLLGVEVVDGSGQVVAADESAPQGGLYPAWRWRAGEAVVERRVVALPPELPVGSYSLQATARDPQLGDDGSGRVLLGQLLVTR